MTAAAYLADDGIDLVVEGRVVGRDDQLYLGEQISYRRGLNGWKQSEVARRMRLDQSIVNLWTSNKRPVPHNRVPRLAEALEIDVPTLLRKVHLVPDGYSRGFAHRPLPTTIPPLTLIREGPLANYIKAEELEMMMGVERPPEDAPGVHPVPAPRVQGTHPLRWCESPHLDLSKPGLADARVKRHHHGPTQTLRGPATTDIGEYV